MISHSMYSSATALQFSYHYKRVWKSIHYLDIQDKNEKNDD